MKYFVVPDEILVNLVLFLDRLNLIIDSLLDFDYLKDYFAEKYYYFEQEVKKGDTINLSFKTKSRVKSNGCMPFIYVSIASLIIFLLCTIKQLRFDSIIEKLKSQYKNIDSVYKKAFWVVFLALNIVFIFHTINFMWGNHD